MLNADQIRDLKRSNISADAEKTKVRTHDVFVGAKSVLKREILQLSGQSRSSIYRIFQTGGISAKVAVAIAQVLGINPRYLVGTADEIGTFSEELLIEFLGEYGYGIVQQERPKRKYTRRAVQPEAAPEAENEDTDAEEEAAAESDDDVQGEDPGLADVVEQTNAFIAALGEEKLQALLHALWIRAEANVPRAQTKLTRVGAILLDL
jgi:transcriptional regulator with XRE-family HTH domain